MLGNLPRVREQMRAIGFKVEIIAEDQVLSDLPDYANLRGQKTRDGRSYDTGTRGVGNRDKCSVGEENLLCRPHQPYPQKDILVHEFSHSIEAHLPPATVAEIEAAYRHALDQSLYPRGGYNQASAYEYFAGGVQAWFGVTLRSDVNGSINSRAKHEAHDPALARVLAEVFGETRVCGYRPLPGTLIRVGRSPPQWVSTTTWVRTNSNMR